MPEARLDDAQLHRAGAYAHAVSGAGEQLARWWRQNPQVPIDMVVEHMMTVVWQGLGAESIHDG